MGNVGTKNVDTGTDYARQQQFASGFVEENSNGGNRSAFMSTPIVNPKVIEDANVSPVEVAKAYMASRGSGISPSMLRMRSHVGREDAGMTKKAPNSMAALDNSFMTPRSRCNMTRTPYSKAHLTSKLSLKGSGSNGFAALSFFPPMRSYGKSESRPMSLKRKMNSIFDDEFGSVSPIRRLRQKPNLLASRIHQTTNGEGIMSHPKQKPLLIGENENESVPTSKSIEVASKILQLLEKISPKEKSPLRSMEDVQDEHKLGDGSNATLADVNNFSTQNQEKEVGPKKSVAPLVKLNSVPNNDSVSNLKASMPSISATSASQPPQKKRSFRMTVEEVDDAHCDGLAPRPFSEKNRPTETSPTDDVAPPEKPKRVKPSIQPADESHLAPISRKTSEANSSAAKHGRVSNVVSLPAPEEKNAASQSAIFPLSVAALDKPRETYNTTLFGSSSASLEKVDSLPSAPVEKVASSVFGSSWQSPNLSTPNFGSSALTSPSPSTGFAFGAPAASSSTPLTSPDKVNPEDSIVQTSVAAQSCFPIFGQQMASSTPPAFGQPTSSTPFAFGSGSASIASQPNPFMFGVQQPNQAVAPQQSPSPFQFNDEVGFSLGSGLGEKSGRKGKTNRNKNRKNFYM